MKKTFLLLFIFITAIFNTNMAKKKNNDVVIKNTVCRQVLQNEDSNYEYIYAGMPVVYNCY